MQFIKKYSRQLLFALKLVIFLITLYYLYYEVRLTENFIDLIGELTDLRPGRVFLLFGIFVLMLLNWGTESRKWQILLRNIQKINLLKSFWAVLSGVTISILMPNRMGEYLGRIFYLSPHSRIKAVLATLVGNFSQLLVTILIGSSGFCIYLSSILIIDFAFYLVLFFVILTNVLLIFLYFNIRLLNRLLPGTRKFTRIRKYVNVFAYYHSSGLLILLLLSLFRYLVFSLQYFFLLWIFGVNLTAFQGALTIPVVFFVQSVVPTIALTELGIRGATAVHFIGAYSSNDAGIVTGAYSLWIINLGLPALIGAMLLLSTRNNRNKGHR